MMSDELARAVERLRQAKTGIRHELAAAGVRRRGDDPRPNGELVPGDRVFDPVTGQEGVIEHAERTNVLIQPAEK